MKIYVCAHKKVKEKLPLNYQYIQANAANNDPIYDLRDDMLDNISKQNPYYCELTIAYWIWKNDKENDIVGLAHYRRFLTTNRFSSSYKKYINSPKVEKILNKYDFIATKKYKSKMTVKEHLLLNVSEHDYNLLRDIIKNEYPDYLNAFDYIMNGHESYLLNMFTTTKTNFDTYYEWLFELLGKVENQVDMTGYTVQQQRLYGFLAERLFSVYIMKNNFKVKSFPTHTVGSSKFEIIYQKLLKILRIKKD